MAEPAHTPTSIEGQPKSLRKSTIPAKAGVEGAFSDPRDFEESTRPGKRPRLNPPQMTAAAAQADAQQRSRQSPPSTQTSPNPASQALNALMGTTKYEMSNANAPQTGSSANPATTVSAPMAIVADNLQQPSGDEAAISGDSQTQTSPVSVSSIGTLGSLAGASGMTTTVGSPLPIEETARQASGTADVGSTSPEDGNKALSYPVPNLLPPPPNGGSRRGMSLPQSVSRQGTRSPSSKKHRCPYCATEFTRHHNLKSHLLTHSQEKPYVCSTCQSRFRRLHDLKRHTKLHTGERPHICPKCGRKFARGDALARHNKGPGGCAGRRASMGSFGGDDDFDGDDSMEGVMYNEPESLDDEAGNDKRPGIRRQAPSGDDTMEDSDHVSRMPSTYPPIQGRPPGGIASGNFPPRGGFGPSGSGSSPSAGSGGTLPYPHPGGSSGSSRHPGVGGVFAQNPLTESPKPLSPGQSHRGSGTVEGNLNRNRSPTMTHFQQPQAQSYSRSTGGSGSSLSIPGSGAQLPPPPGLNPPDPRFTLPSQGPTHPPTQPTGPPTHMGSGPLSSHSNSLSSHGQSGHGSGEATSPMFAKEDRLWAYVKSLEQRMNSMQDEISSLRSQLASATQVQQARM
jgi:DNA-directed RNA polymerase subunit RPC12/RpoP